MLGLATRASSISLMQPIWNIASTTGSMTTARCQQSRRSGLPIPGVGLRAMQISCEEVLLPRRIAASIHQEATASWRRTRTVVVIRQRMAILMSGWHRTGRALSRAVQQQGLQAGERVLGKSADRGLRRLLRLISIAISAAIVVQAACMTTRVLCQSQD